MNQELNPERCREIRQIFRDSDRRVAEINREITSQDNARRSAVQQIPKKKTELGLAQLRVAGADALNLISRGPLAGATSLAISSMSSAETERLESEIRELNNIIDRSERLIPNLRNERDRIQENDTRLATEGRRLNCVL